MRARKGLTLVEVVVAVSILAIVFSGTVTLVVNVTKLAMSSRDKTTVTALAQKGISKKLSEQTFGCSTVFPLTPYTFTESGYTVNVEVQPVKYQTGIFLNDVNGHFVQITSTVTKDGQTFYSIKQVMRNS